MKRSSLAMLLAALTASSVFAGCAGQGNTSSQSGSSAENAPAPVQETSSESAPPSQAAAAGGETIKIGYVSALSGDTALWGQAGLNGMQFAAEKINAEGGILGKQVEIVGLDGKGDPIDSVTALKKLIDEYKVCAVVGTNFSSCNIPMASVADQMQVPVIATAASNELVTVDEGGKLHPYSFRLCFIDSFQGEVLGRYAAQKLGYKNGAMLTDITDAYSTGVGKFIATAFEANGGKMIAQEEAQSGDQDFRAQLTKIAATKPDVLFVPWIYQNVALISKQARELGITCPILGTDGWDSLELAEMAAGALEGCSYVSRVGFNSPEAAAYGEEYVKKFNVSLEAECLYGNDGMYWIKDAIERAGSADPKAIRDALESTDTFSGLLGKMTMDSATHNPQREIAVFTCKDNKFEFVEIYQ